jgi:signal transduction histidine kinase
MNDRGGGVPEIRDQVLALTSDLRVCLNPGNGGGGDEAEVESLRTVARAVSAAVQEHGLGMAVRHATALQRIAALGTLATSTQESDGFRSGIRGVVGIVEQAVESCLDGAAKEHVESLYQELLGAVPEPWRGYINLDDAAFEARLEEGRGALRSEPEVPPTEDSPDPEKDAATEVFRAFVAEAEEGLQRAEEYVVRLESDPGGDETLASLFGELHTLKGAAAAAGLSDAAAQLHDGESLLAAIREGQAAEDMEALPDRLFCLIDSVRALVEEEWARRQAALQASPGKHASGPTLNPIDALTSGREAVDRGLQELTAVGSEDSGQVDDQMQSFLRALDQQTRQFSEIAENLRQQMTTMRLVPLDRLFRRLLRPARDAARQQGKVVDVVVSDGSPHVDRAVAERLIGVLLHVVRNAVSHGIEKPDVREAAGKDAKGTLRVQARAEKQQVVITVEDDGGGLDLEAIRRRAEDVGYLEEGASATREELVRFIFRPEFSTSAEVTDLAGRGVGLDAVAREVRTLKGRIAVDTRTGRGCRFRILLPAADEPPAATHKGRPEGAGRTASER